jgi:integrase
MTVKEVLDKYEVSHLPNVISASRIRASIVHLKSILESSLPAETLKPEDLQRYRVLRLGCSAGKGTINRELGTLAAAYRFCSITPPKISYDREAPKTRSISSDSVKRLISYAPNLQTKAFIALSFATGQRKDAVKCLRKSQIVNGVIEFEADGYEKASRRKRRARTPVTPGIQQVLDTLRLAFGDTEYVIPNRKGGNRPYSSIARSFKRASEASGLMVTPHVLRHSAATVALEKGASIEQVSRLLGHASTAVTERVYVHAKPEFIQSAVESLGEGISI